MTYDNKPKANWTHNFGPVSVSEKGYMKITDNVTGHSAMFSSDLCELMINHAEDMIKALEQAKAIRNTVLLSREEEKAKRQAAKLAERETKKIQAAVEQLQRIESAGVNLQDLLSFVTKKQQAS